jgi:ankyrin repeat protein
MWIACCKGNAGLVKSILSLDVDTRDEPSPDGTSAFCIALAKGYEDIVQMFLTLDIGQSRSLYLDSRKTRDKTEADDATVARW